MTSVDTKREEQEQVTLGEVMRDAQELTHRFIKSLDVMCAKGIIIDRPSGEEMRLKEFPEKLRFSPLTYGDLAEMVQRRKADALRLYRNEVYSNTVLAKHRFQDLHVVLHRLAMPEDFAFTDPANVRNAVQLSLCRGHCAGSWKPSLEQVDKLLADESFKALVLDVIEIETYGPGSTDTKKGNDGAANPTVGAERADTTTSKTTPI